MIYNLRTLRQVYCETYPCPEESKLTCEFDDFSRFQFIQEVEDWSQPVQNGFEAAFGCPS